MAQLAYTENIGNAGKAGNMSKADTSQSKKQKSSQSDLQPTTLDDDDVLKMVQTMMNRANELPGVEIQRTSIFHEGQRVAAAVFFGCDWDDDGNLITIKKSVGNVGNPVD